MSKRCERKQSFGFSFWFWWTNTIIFFIFLNFLGQLTTYDTLFLTEISFFCIFYCNLLRNQQILLLLHHEMSWLLESNLILYSFEVLNSFTPYIKLTSAAERPNVYDELGLKSKSLSIEKLKMKIQLLFQGLSNESGVLVYGEILLFRNFFD